MSGPVLPEVWVMETPEGGVVSCVSVYVAVADEPAPFVAVTVCVPVALEAEFSV